MPTSHLPRTFSSRRLVARLAVLSALLAASAGAVAEEALTSAQTALFKTPHLDNVEVPQTLHYDFIRRGPDVESIDDAIDVVVTEIDAEGRKNLVFEFLSGERQRRFPPLTGYRGNPLIMLFLEHDVTGMARATGGSELFFRNRIRESFGTRAAVEEVTLTLEGDQVAGRLVTVEPFVEAPLIERFPSYRHKRYEFLLSAAVPGGVARLSTFLPDRGGAVAVEETVTFKGIEP